MDPKVCADPSWFLVFKDGLKKCSSFKINSHFDGQNGQKLPETCDEIFLDPPFMPTSKTFETVLTDPIRPNVS